MPKVGKKTFPYTAAGQEAATTYAGRTGKKMTPKKAKPTSVKKPMPKKKKPRGLY